MPFNLTRFAVLGVLILLFNVVYAQQPLPEADITAILNAMNRSRLPENLVHLVPNPQLMQLAQDYVDDLLQRISNLGDPFVSSEGLAISDLLERVEYAPYSDGYIVDFVPIIIRNVPPTDIVNYWIADANRDRELLSLRISQGREQFLPIYSPLYREVGIAAQQDASGERYIYVFVFASQPQVLPVVVAVRPNFFEIASTVTTRDVLVYISDERARRFGDGENMGGVRYMRVSEESEQLPCPTQITNDWDFYANENGFQLSDRFGAKTIYVQLCDNSGRSVVSTARVSYVDPNEGTATASPSLPTPDVLLAANMTQTAAAIATANEPYRPTIEAILTATAMPNNP